MNKIAIEGVSFPKRTMVSELNHRREHASFISSLFCASRGPCGNSRTRLVDAEFAVGERLSSPPVCAKEWDKQVE
jgi:hypothetical protein